MYIDALMKKVKIGIRTIGVKFLEGGREWRLAGLVFVDNLFLCGESEEGLKVLVLRFVKGCRRRGLNRM